MRSWPRKYGLVGLVALLALASMACSSDNKNYGTEDAVDVQAAVRLNQQAERFTRLQAIAARPYLAPSAQVLLIDETLGTPLMAAQKADILVTLVRNPNLNVRAKGYLLDRLKEGALPVGEQQMVMRAMVDNPTSRFYADEDTPAGVIDAVRATPAVSATVAVEEMPMAAQPAEPRGAKPESTIGPEPITITPLPVK